MKTHFVYKPKIQPLPRTLIWDTKLAHQDFYKMFTTKNPRVVGIMSADNSKIGQKDYYHILFLFIKEQRQGYGKDFIDFAKNISKEKGCDGRLFLLADKEVYGAKKPPHIFYRKQGFTTNDKKYLKYIDKFIRENKEMENKDSKPIYMYYDPNKRGLLQRIKDFLNLKFNIE